MKECKRNIHIYVRYHFWILYFSQQTYGNTENRTWNMESSVQLLKYRRCNAGFMQKHLSPSKSVCGDDCNERNYDLFV